MNLFDHAKKFKEGAKIITEWLGQGAITVDRETAQARADVCLKCPLNVKEGSFTRAVADAIKRQLEIKSKMNLRVNGEKSLHTCTGCGCANRLKIWLPMRNILPLESEMPSFHESCWLRNNNI